VTDQRPRRFWRSTTKTSHWGEGVTAEEMQTLHWVRPTQVIEVSFTEWTREGNLRHAAFAVEGLIIFTLAATCQSA